MIKPVRHGNLIRGEFVESSSLFEDRNPADPEDLIAYFPESSHGDVVAAASAAADALAVWREMSPVVRGRYLFAIASTLQLRENEIVAAITREQGKPLAESRAEFGKCVEYFQYYGGRAYEFGGRILPSVRPGLDIQLRREPVGVCALITPWNVPLAIPARKIAPALLCGNTVVVKPSVETPLACQFIGEAAQEAGLPAGVLNIVHGRGSEVGDALARSAVVRAISFTGSTVVGRHLAKIAAERLVRVQLELGGKNAAIVLEDADLDLAAEQITIAAFTTTGQQCTATSRVLVRQEVLAELTRRLVDRARNLKVGPGTEPETKIGPLVSERHLVQSLAYVKSGTEEGANILIGGEREDRAGFFLGPTLFSDVDPDMRVAREEIFGPVLAIMSVASDESALTIANHSDYGLSAAVYTRSLSRAYRFARGLEAGAVAVNAPSAGWEVQVPFGGVKESGGTGWKEQGLEALDFFSDLKAVQIWPG